MNIKDSLLKFYQLLIPLFFAFLLFQEVVFSAFSLSAKLLLEKLLSIVTLYTFLRMLASNISRYLSINRFSGFLWVFTKIKFTIAEIFQTNINQKQKFMPNFSGLFSLVLDERAPSFAKTICFVNYEIKTWHITFFYNFQ